MEVRKAISIKFLIFFIIFLLLSTYFFLYKPYLKQQAKNNQTVSKLKHQVYENLDFNTATIYTGNDHTWYTIRGITDGKAITSPIQIKTKAGELLAESKLAYKVYYVHQEKIKETTVILLAELKEKSDAYIVFNSEIGLISSDKFQNEYNRLVNLLQTPGKVVGISFFTTLNSIDQQNSMFQKQKIPLISSFKSLQDFLRLYLQDREEEMNKFTIGKSLDNLLPIGFTSETFQNNKVDIYFN